MGDTVGNMMQEFVEKGFVKDLITDYTSDVEDLLEDKKASKKKDIKSEVKLTPLELVKKYGPNNHKETEKDEKVNIDIENS